MNFDAHIEFFGTILHAQVRGLLVCNWNATDTHMPCVQVRKVSKYAMELGVRPGMLVRYVHEWDCSHQPLEQVSKQSGWALLVRFYDEKNVWCRACCPSDSKQTLGTKAMQPRQPEQSLQMQRTKNKNVTVGATDPCARARVPTHQWQYSDESCSGTGSRQ